jgi:putative resolvase
MVYESELKKEWYRPGEIAKMLGVSSRTILNYRENGLFEMRLDESNNRRYASKEELIKLLKYKGVFYSDVVNDGRKVAIYARVSSYDQKKNGDLDRQIIKLEKHIKNSGIHNYELFSDVGSGLNTKRRGLNKLLDEVVASKISVVYVTYLDRLTRFGLEYLDKIFKYFDTKVISLDEREEKTEQEELVDDMITLLASFSGKLYGMRSHSKVKVKKAFKGIEEEMGE